ncbi:MAG: glutamine-hydrolyzing carbamoyl-phosphate synthase small subunit [Polyangiaceae bacterium]|nr:glutamine-hydrolyzing carbamoyl-phosphate synthase small subunit [Polyangiaceae bacterium]
MSANATNLEPAYLVLADGTTFPGHCYGARGTTTGEAVFTTTMTGYQEVLTDPSYCGQIVTMTAPEIGNVGINALDTESVSGKPQACGFVLRDASPIASSWRSEQTLEAYLAEHGIVAIGGVDTRKLTRHLRDHGAQNAAIGTKSPSELLRAARNAPPMNGLDLVKRVTPKEPYTFTEGLGDWCADPASPARPAKAREHHVVAIDYGVKKNILRCLVNAGCRVTVVPATTSAKSILDLCPDGIFLSNGPGDPSAVGYAVEILRELIGKKPIFGICLGHQLLALALGGKTYKLKFGHRGSNQPVKDLATGRIEITTQNHGFCVDLTSLPAGIESTHVHLNDGTSEGLSAKGARAFSVQYHPEASAGPHDSFYLFDRFVGMMA